MRDGVGRADVFAASTEHDTWAWIFSHGSFFSVFLLKFEGSHVAEVYTFAAGYAFFVIYFWSPWDFASGNSFVCFFILGQANKRLILA